MHRLSGHKRRVTNVAWSTTCAAVLASAAYGANGDVRVWDVSQGKSILSLDNDAVSQIAFSVSCWRWWAAPC